MKTKHNQGIPLEQRRDMADMAINYREYYKGRFKISDSAALSMISQNIGLDDRTIENVIKKETRISSKTFNHLKHNLGIILDRATSANEVSRCILNPSINSLIIDFGFDENEGIRPSADSIKKALQTVYRTFHEYHEPTTGDAISNLDKLEKLESEIEETYGKLEKSQNIIYFYLGKIPSYTPGDRTMIDYYNTVAVDNGPSLSFSTNYIYILAAPLFDSRVPLDKIIRKEVPWNRFFYKKDALPESIDKNKKIENEQPKE